MNKAQVLGIHPSERNVWSSDACSSAQAAASLRHGQALMRSTWATLYCYAEFNEADIAPKTAWAHANCLTAHTCGTYSRFTKFVKSMRGEPAVRAMVHLLCREATRYDPQPSVWKDGLPMYSERWGEKTYLRESPC